MRTPAGGRGKWTLCFDARGFVGEAPPRLGTPDE